jgi:hypothetical protein
MGTRVHKVIGYGFHRLRKNDPIINKQALEACYERTTEEFIAFLETKKGEGYHASLVIQDVKRCDWEPYDSVKSSGYHDKTIVFTPPSYKDWSRYDDIIDYAEVCYLGKTPRDTVKQLDVPIYPFISWMDKNTGKPLTREENDLAFVAARLRSSKIKPTESNILAVSERMVPDIPKCIRYFLEFSKIVPGEAIKELRPMIYTYWC